MWEGKGGNVRQANTIWKFSCSHLLCMQPSLPETEVLETALVPATPNTWQGTTTGISCSLLKSQFWNALGSTSSNATLGRIAFYSVLSQIVFFLYQAWRTKNIKCNPILTLVTIFNLFTKIHFVYIRFLF